MRNAKRAVAATALGLPLIFGAPGVALADSADSQAKKCDSKSDKKKDCKVNNAPFWVQLQEQEAAQENKTEQTNENASPIYQWNVGGDQSAMTWNKQDNWNATEQNQDQKQEQEQEQELNKGHKKGHKKQR